MDELIAVLAADAADGVLDGNIPVSLTPTPEEEALLLQLATSLLPAATTTSLCLL